MSNPYEVLGLAPDASEKDRKSAYRKLAMQYHPDRNPGDAEAEKRFIEINNANEAIEKGWRPGMPPPGSEQPGRGQPQGGFREFHFTGGNFDDLFAAFTAQARQRNRDFETQAMISLEDAFAGTEITVQVQEGDKQRTIKVQLPPGVDTGNRMRVPQAGEQTHASLKPGDLYVTVMMARHDRFQRQGANLVMIQKIGLFDLMLGTKLSLTGIDGKEIELTVPPGCTPDQQFRLHGQGMPILGQPGTRGDLFVLPEVIFPVLDDTQRATLATLREQLETTRA